MNVVALMEGGVREGVLFTETRTLLELLPCQSVAPLEGRRDGPLRGLCNVCLCSVYSVSVDVWRGWGGWELTEAHSRAERGVRAPSRPE